MPILQYVMVREMSETCGANTNAVGLKIRPETVGRVLVGPKSIIVIPNTMEELD